MTIDFAQYATLIVFIGLASIIGAVAGVSTIIKNIALTKATRDPARMPPLAEELAKVYATKAELISLRDDLKENCRLQHIQVDKIQGDLFSLIRKTQNDILAKLDNLSNEIGAWQRGIERQIGKFEGKIEGR